MNNVIQNAVLTTYLFDYRLINSQTLSANAPYNSPSNLFASFREDFELWLESFDTEKPFYIVGQTNVDVLQNQSKTASYIDLLILFPVNF